MRYAHVVWSERAGVSACVDQCLPCSRATQMPLPRPQIDEPKVPSTFDFLITHARVLRIRDSRFSFQSGAD